ncbi:group II truncated hemoglobin [Roseovarius dicentrarchi]|uniref:group II truncated hemoglobin n=1 Tax=Roseovarius dicentrarchi TaxID=2250573 RepID=UPI000DEA3490|nr:group II truncated hemoglobin [Roseovarius dicentrarchi]
MTQTVLDKLGGEDALKELVEHFYDLVESTPEGAQIVRLHMDGHGLAATRKQQFNFLCGFFGGRQYYKELHGHMNVKLIHEHIPIMQKDAEDWLLLMDRALDDLGHSGPHVDRLRATLRRVALVLVNDGAVVGADSKRLARL